MPWFGLLPVEKRPLLPDEEILRGKGAAGVRGQQNELTEIKQNRNRRPKAVPQSGKEEE